MSDQNTPNRCRIVLITPPPVSNVILRNGKLEQGGVICELGIYGTCVWNQITGEVQHNQEEAVGVYVVWHCLHGPAAGATVQYDVPTHQCCWQCFVERAY